jgi:Di-haem oxidoreductase, putative peroxidase
MNCNLFRFLFAAAVTSLFATEGFAQHDPGVRGGLQNTGGGLQAQGIKIPPPPLISDNPTTGARITDNEKRSFIEGILRAGQLESTCDDCAMVTDGSPVVKNPINGLRELDPTFPQFTTNSNGLGARHNADQCFACHGHPTLGGSGGFLVPNPIDLARFGPAAARPPENPQFDLVPHRFGRRNVVPSFQEQYGPIREVRFIWKVDANGDFIQDNQGQLIPDGGVHQLWTVRGDRTDRTIPNCAIVQPDFEKQVRQNNVAFRIPLQMTGLGLIESIQDREILARQAATANQRAALGIKGKPNRSGNDGTITRFGWKAQNKSLVIFAGEAYNVEQGITNEVFPTPTEEDPNCNGPGKPAPNDVTRMDTTDEGNQAFNNPLHIMADWMQFSLLMRFTDGPQPVANMSQSALRGKQVFSDVGCALCHTPAMQTAPVMNSAVLQNRPVNLYSDLMVHDMGTGLADGVSQGAAGPREFRTTPLWGVGQRIFFLHDGRTNDLLEAIRAHASNGSEANAVISAFNNLATSDKQAILNFLRSL